MLCSQLGFHTPLNELDLKIKVACLFGNVKNHQILPDNIKEPFERCNALFLKVLDSSVDQTYESQMILDFLSHQALVYVLHWSLFNSNCEPSGSHPEDGADPKVQSHFQKQVIQLPLLPSEELAPTLRKRISWM